MTRSPFSVLTSVFNSDSQVFIFPLLERRQSSRVHLRKYGTTSFLFESTTPSDIKIYRKRGSVAERRLITGFEREAEGELGQEDVLERVYNNVHYICLLLRFTVKGVGALNATVLDLPVSKFERVIVAIASRPDRVAKLESS